MDFKDLIKQLGERVEKLKSSMPTEEATKNALIMPMLSALGYNVFDPTEVMPEFTCDIGTKKGEKIDYAIMMNDEPVILIECKQWQQDLTLHDNQLLRYFNVSPAKFGILTNGIKYRFYTDLEEPNKMDNVPFLEIDLENLTDSKISELRKFHKSYFDIDSVLGSANELKYLGELRSVIHDEFSSPSTEFVRFFGKKIYHGMLTQRVLDDLTPLVKKSIDSYINELISDRLKVAIDKSENEENRQNREEVKEEEKEYDNGITTTEEELEGFYIVKAILSRVLYPGRISYKDTQSYFAIIIDNKITQTVCRLRFNYAEIRRVGFINDDKSETTVDLENGVIAEIYKHEDKLLEIANRFRGK